jgi:hypothetical protein
MSKLKVFAFWFCAEAFIYGLVVANGRAYNQANYLATLFTDMMISGFNFWFAVKFIEGKDNRTFPALAGCVLGGGSGSLLAIFITTRFYGQ